MAYVLGIDVGTSSTAAAVRRSGRSGREAADLGVEVVALGARAAVVPTVMYIAEDGTALVGEAAERRALTDPDRVVREFKRRLGDEVPLVVGGLPYAADHLVALVVRWTVDRVAEREGGPADAVVVTHPAAWGPYKVDVLRRALVEVDLPDVELLSEPEAAAIGYAARERVRPDETVAVYDLGGGTFDAAVLHRDEAGDFDLLGEPAGLSDVGGVDFDDAVFAHVQEALGDQLAGLDPADPAVLLAAARLRQECVEAKEALSVDTEVVIPVLLPGLQTSVRLVRAEFEDRVRPAVEQTLGALRTALDRAGVTPADLGAVLLVGGSSRVPLVAQMVSEALDRPVVVDADPKTAIAQGAAAWAATSDAAVAATARDTGAPTGAALGAAVGAAGGVLAADAAGRGGPGGTGELPVVPDGPTALAPGPVDAVAGGAPPPRPPVAQLATDRLDDEDGADDADDGPDAGDEDLRAGAERSRRNRTRWAVAGAAAVAVVAAVIGVSALVPFRTEANTPAPSTTPPATTSASVPPVPGAPVPTDLPTSSSAPAEPEEGATTTTTTRPGATTTTTAPAPGTRPPGGQPQPQPEPQPEPEPTVDTPTPTTTTTPPPVTTTTTTQPEPTEPTDPPPPPGGGAPPAAAPA